MFSYLLNSILPVQIGACGGVAQLCIFIFSKHYLAILHFTLSNNTFWCFLPLMTCHCLYAYFIIFCNIM